MNIYTIDFKKRHIKTKNRLKISRFIPEDMKYLIQRNVPEKHYILGVTYNTGDSQICISGHPKENENLEQGACRELNEELCLKNLKQFNFCHTKGVNHFCFMNIKDTCLSFNNRKNDLNDLKERAVICIYGEEKDILYYMANVNYNLNNEDRIDSIWSSSKEDIITCIEAKKYYMSNF